MVNDMGTLTLKEIYFLAHLPICLTRMEISVRSIRFLGLLLPTRKALTMVTMSIFKKRLMASMRTGSQQCLPVRAS